MNAPKVAVRPGAGKPTLHLYDSAEELRPATAEEHRASIAAAELDGGAGVIRVEGRRCYVADPTGPAADDCPPTLATGGSR